MGLFLVFLLGPCLKWCLYLVHNLLGGSQEYKNSQRNCTRTWLASGYITPTGISLAQTSHMVHLEGREWGGLWGWGRGCGAVGSGPWSRRKGWEVRSITKQQRVRTRDSVCPRGSRGVGSGEQRKQTEPGSRWNVPGEGRGYLCYDQVSESGFQPHER